MSGTGNDANTTLLTHCTTLPPTDVAVGNVGAHVFTVNGPGVTLNSSSFAFAPASISFDGVSGDNVTTNNAADLSWGTADFTLDFWLNPQGVLTPSCPLAIGGSGNGIAIRLNFVNPGRPDVFFGGQGGRQANWNSGLVTGSWNWVLFQRNGNTLYGYLNGVLQQAEAIPAAVAQSTTTGMTIGQGPSEGTPLAAWSGLVDEIRLSTIARYPGGPANIGIPQGPYVTDFGYPGPNIMAPMLAQ